MTASRLTRFFPALGALALVLLPYLFFALGKWYSLPLDNNGTPIGPNDPDPWLRLTLVREWLTSGDWYSHAVPRTNTPLGGITSPWTRPVDIALALLTALQPETVELNLRLMRAALLLPALWMSLLLLGIYRIVRIFSPLPSACLMASLMVASMPATWNYFGLANADHHAPLASLFVWVMGWVLQPDMRPRDALFAGVALALMLWISFEAIILIAIIYLWFGLHWLRGDHCKTRLLTWVSTSTALAAALALMIEVPRKAWLTAQYDTLSIAYIALLALAAALAWVMRWTGTARLRLLIVGAAGLGAAGTATYIFPGLLAGPYAGLDPYITSTFMPRISEAKAFYRVETLPLIATMYLPLFALMLCAAAWLRPHASFYTKPQAQMIAYFIGSTLLLYLSQQRWSYYLLPLTSVALAPVLAALFAPEDTRVSHRWPATRMQCFSPLQQSCRRMPIIVAVLALPMSLMWLNNALTATNTADAKLAAQRNACYRSARQLIRSGELTRVLDQAPRNILAPTDLGAEILFFTPHRIVASNYHREGAGIQYVWESENLETAAQLRRYLAQRSMDTLLICPSLTSDAKKILSAYYAGAKLADWLEPVPYRLPPTKTPSTEQRSAPLLLRVATK